MGEGKIYLLIECDEQSKRYQLPQFRIKVDAELRIDP